MTWGFCPNKHTAVQSSFKAQGDLRNETLAPHVSLNGLETESNLKGTGRGNSPDLPKTLSIQSFDVEGKLIHQNAL